MRPPEPLAPAPGLVHWLADAQAPVSLVCFHCAGASAQSFFPWIKPARGLCELYAVELPGRSRRHHEPFADSVLALARQFAEQCLALAGKPMIFFGHSLGALMAYETARALVVMGASAPVHLIVASRQSPHWLPVCSGLPELNDRALRDYLRALDGTPLEVLQNQALMDRAVPILQADLTLIHGYRHESREPLGIPIDALGALDDNHVRFESMLGWEQASDRAFNLHMIEGGHFAAMQQPQHTLQRVSDIARRLEI